ncbi:MAG: TonB-dependent receptor [Bacteroidales bacterium]|nr:TonB-dependent receptor [Bacteroidales bacterium]MDD4829675.1 TonB-dependent receptor [Bacteroidales bacterium]
MKKIILYIFTLVLILIVSNNVYSQTSAPKIGSVSGKVLNKNTNQPIPYANVMILGTTLGSSTDEKGYFEIKDVPIGFIRVVVSVVGYKNVISDELQIYSNHSAYTVIKIEEAPTDLLEVNIVAVKEKSKESPISLRTISLQDIEKSPGSNRDVSKAVQNLPGVAAGAVNRNDLIVRGGGPSENVFFLDDVEIPIINHFATQGASGGAVGILNPDFVRQVDFLSGAFPSNRGGALSSVMNIKQKEGSRDKMHFKGSIGASDLALTFDLPIKDNNLLFSYRRSYLQFLFTALGLPFLPSYDDIQFRYKWNIDQHNELLFLGIAAFDRSELNLSIDKPTESQQYLLNSLPDYNQLSYTVGAVYKHYNDNSIDMVVLSRNMLRNAFEKYPNNDKNLAKLLDYSSVEAENKLRYEKRYTTLPFELSFGANMRYSKYTNDSKRTININNILFEDNYNSLIDLFSYGLFVQTGDAYFKERLKLGMGARFDGNSYSKLMSNPFVQFSPRISASYLFNEHLSINGNIGHYTKEPSYTSMGYKDSNDVFVNKASLKYIHVNHYVLGLEFNAKAKIKASLEGFYKQYYNYPITLNEGISLASKGNDFGAVGDEPLISEGKGRAYGFEALFTANDIKKFNIYAVFTYFVSEFTNIDGKYISSSWDNRFILNLTASRKFKYDWLVSARWRLIGGSPYTPIDEYVSSQRQIWDARNQPYLDYNRFNTLRLGNYHQLDIRVDKEFAWKSFDITLYLDVQNVYNFKSESEPIYTNLDINGNPNLMPDNQTYILRNISTTSGTILPTFGLIVYF